MGSLGTLSVTGIIPHMPDKERTHADTCNAVCER